MNAGTFRRLASWNQVTRTTALGPVSAWSTVVQGMDMVVLLSSAQEFGGDHVLEGRQDLVGLGQMAREFQRDEAVHGGPERGRDVPWFGVDQQARGGAVGD